jgi:putative phage-type endonuclease
MKKRTPSPVPGSPEWIEQRRHGIFATDAATVTGRSPFSSPFDKFAELQGTTAPKIATDAMEWGILLQPVVGRAWAREHDHRVRPCPWTYWLEDGIGSHYDFDVVGYPSILEVKTASAYAQRDWGEEETGEIPEAYFLQCQHEMMCRPNIDRCYVAVLIGGQKLKSYCVVRDPDLIEDLLRIERRFLANSRLGIAPEMDGSEAATAYLRGLSPRDNGERWELPESVEEIATAYLSAKEQEKVVIEQKDALANRLREAMGDHAAATGKLVRLSYKTGKDRTVVDWRTVADHWGKEPDYEYVRNLYTEVTPGNRPLIVSLLGDA